VIFFAPSQEASTTSLPGSQKNTLVIGIGNPLQGDDGVGVRVAEQLANESLPPGVQVQELGTPGWGLVNALEGWQRIILIDAVQMGAEPGAWRRLDGDQVSLINNPSSLSLHEPGLAESLALARALNLLPEELVLYAIEPGHIGPVEQLTPAVADALPALVKQILEDIWKET